MNTKKPVLIFTEQMARESFIFDGPVNLTPNKLKPISVGVKTDLKQNIREIGRAHV